MQSLPQAALGLAAALVTGCSTSIGSLAPRDAETASPAPARVSASSGPSPGSNAAIEAARTLLEAQAAGVEMSVRREKRPDDPIETLFLVDGRVEPALRRGHVKVDFSGMLEIPGTSPSPNLDSVAEVVWTPDEMFARSPAQPDEGWTARSRADARSGSGLIGRLPDEVEGLMKLVAESDQSAFAPAEDASIDGQVARRWTLRVPVEDAAAKGVPVDVPNAAVLRDTYGIGEIEIDAWLVDGALRRLRYAIAREHAAYGGPDRTTVTYDWTPTEDAEPIAVPSAGQ